jgi:hypothetical protein
MTQGDLRGQNGTGGVGNTVWRLFATPPERAETTEGADLSLRQRTTAPQESERP